MLGKLCKLFTYFNESSSEDLKFCIWDYEAHGQATVEIQHKKLSSVWLIKFIELDRIAK